MAKDGGGGCLVILTRWIALRSSRDGLSLLCLDIAVLHLRFRPSLFDRLTVRRFRTCLRKARLTGFDVALNEVLRAETSFMSDRITQAHILFGACVLAAYRVLRRSGVSEAEAKEVLLPVVCGTARRTKAVIMWGIRHLTRDPFRSIERHSRQQLPRQYGPSFEITHSRTSEGFVSEVTTCGYKTFLMRHQATELLQIFCEWDRVWIDETDPHKLWVYWAGSSPGDYIRVFTEQSPSALTM